MPLFRKPSQRQVQHSDDSPIFDRPSSIPLADTIKPARSRRRKIFKWLAIIFSSLILLVGLAIVALYFYIDNTPLKGEKEGRINILVLGVDDAASLSDTIMLVSLDVRHGLPPKAALVSIPRDLDVTIPDFGETKINAAYTYGQNNHYPGGGPALTSRTLTEVSGQPIDYYAALNFTGFKELIDAAGGLTIKVDTQLSDPEYPCTNNPGKACGIDIKPGTYHMDGAMALKFARCRKGTCGNDFGRAARQQQVILALRHELLSFNTLRDHSRIKTIQRILQKHLKTNLSTRQTAKLALLWHRIPPTGIKRHVIDSTNLLVGGYNGYALVPRAGPGNYSEIKKFIANIFSLNKNTLPQN